MRILQGLSVDKSSRAMPAATALMQGFASWVVRLLRDWRGQHQAQRRQLQLVETLPLGGKRQLMLVTCGEESFLVGGGVESVETIVRLRSDISNALAKHLDEPCQ